MFNHKEIEYPIISHPYGEKFFTSLYKMHRYWGRKPANVAASYIENYCPKNCIVLDPFLGSGTTAIEAIRLGRKVIGIDINPLAIFITKTTLRPVRLLALEETYKSIIDKVIDSILPWYETKCIHCGKKSYILYVLFEGNNDNDLKEESAQQIFYRCRCSSQTIIKNPDNKDKHIIESSKKIKINDWYPNNLALPKIRPGKREAKNIYDLFTLRNLYSLSKIHSTISNLSSGNIRDCLLLAFSSSLPQCSRLSGIDKRDKARITSKGWVLSSFWIMREHIEKNPLRAFDYAFRRVLKGKTESNSVLTSYIEAKSINDMFNGPATAFIHHASVNDLKSILGNRRVDYVFTDPPHGASQQFMKISTLSNSWLKLPLSSNEEIVQEPSPKSSFDEYQRKLCTAFKNIRSVVSDSTRVHIYYRGREEEKLFGTSSSLAKGGFKLERAIFQPQRYGFRTTFRGRGGYTMPSTPLGDWIFRLKPIQNGSKSSLDLNSIEKNIIAEAVKMLLERGQPTQFQDILLYLISKIPSKLLVTYPDFIREVLEKQIGKKFTRIIDERSLKSTKALWSLREMPKETKPLDIKIEKTIINKFIGREKIGVSRPYIYQAIYSQFTGNKIPDQSTIEKVLKKITVKEKKGKGIKPIRLYLKEEYAEKREVHSKLILALLNAGTQNGFQVYVSPKAIKRIINSDLNYEFSPFFKENRKKILLKNDIKFNNLHIENANILWIRDKRVHAHFEVEDKIEINEDTYRRGEEVRKKWPESERVLVVPHKIIKSIIGQLKDREITWHIIPHYSILAEYDPLEYRPFKKKESPSISLARPLNLKIISKEDIYDSNNNNVAFKLKLSCPSSILKLMQPGHFLMIELNRQARQYLSRYPVSKSYANLKKSPIFNPGSLEFLRIPISIHRIYYDSFDPSALKSRFRDFLPPVFWNWIQPSEKRYLDLLVRIVGHGTKILSRLREGDIIKAIGPLGKPIKFNSDFSNAFLIAGGIGIASLYPVAHYLRERGYRVILFAGSRDKHTLEDSSGNVLPDFNEMGIECHITDEISEKKFVTDIFSEWLNSKEYPNLHGNSHIYSCGPWLMLKEVNKIALKWKLPCTVFVDRLMLCGLGACMSCVLKLRSNSNSGNKKEIKPVRMARACTEGPAFESKDIIWD